MSINDVPEYVATHNINIQGREDVDSELQQITAGIHDVTITKVHSIRPNNSQSDLLKYTATVKKATWTEPTVLPRVVKRKPNKHSSSPPIFHLEGRAVLHAEESRSPSCSANTEPSVRRNPLSSPASPIRSPLPPLQRRVSVPILNTALIRETSTRSTASVTPSVTYSDVRSSLSSLSSSFSGDDLEERPSYPLSNC